MAVPGLPRTRHEHYQVIAAGATEHVRSGGFSNGKDSAVLSEIVEDCCRFESTLQHWSEAQGSKGTQQASSSMARVW